MRNHSRTTSVVLILASIVCTFPQKSYTDGIEIKRSIRPTGQKNIGLPGSPLIPVPPDRHGTLAPGPVLIDSTWVIHMEPRDNPFPQSAVVEDNYIFFATGQGITIFDISNPDVPRKVNYIDGSGLSRLKGAYWAHSDVDFLMNYVDAPPGNSSMIAAGSLSYGLFIMDTRNKSIDEFHYQDAGDGGHYVTWIHAAHINGRYYVFAASNTGLLLYDMTAASSLSSCLENTKKGESKCPGVYLGVMQRNGVGSIHGPGDFVSVRIGSYGIEIYHVTDPESFVASNPVLSGQLPGIGSAVALWEHNYDHDEFLELYMAVLIRGLIPGSTKLRSSLLVYDVSCVYASDDCGLGDPQAEYDVTDWLRRNSFQEYLTLSIDDDGTPYLYVGNGSTGRPLVKGDSCRQQREYLLNLSLYDPNGLVSIEEMDLTPPVNVNGDGYWGWYYQECHRVEGGVLVDDPPGFNDVVPLCGVVSGGRMYRCGYTFADSHLIIHDLIFSDGFEDGTVGRWSHSN